MAENPKNHSLGNFDDDRFAGEAGWDNIDDLFNSTLRLTHDVRATA
jgi:hypothetical protein